MTRSGSTYGTPPGATRLAIAAIVATLLLGGCTTMVGPHGPVRLDPPFWEAPARPVDVVLFPAPAGGIYREGGDDVLHALITDERDRELITLVEASEPDFQWLVDRFAALFADRGFPVAQLSPSDVEITEADDAEMQYAFGGNLYAEPPFRIRPELAATRPTELLLVVAPAGWGLVRHYEFGAIPIGAHYATFEVVIELWDLPGRRKLWSVRAEGSRALPRQWNEPPDHPKVREALEAALEECGNDAVSSLERWGGARAELEWPEPKPAASR